MSDPLFVSYQLSKDFQQFIAATSCYMLQIIQSKLCIGQMIHRVHFALFFVENANIPVREFNQARISEVSVPNYPFILPNEFIFALNCRCLNKLHS